jgi:voltage-gated potassium channel
MRRLISKSTDTFLELAAFYAVLLGGCAAVYAYAEGKGLGDALWWASVTATTVGYGDMYPLTTLGRIAAVVLMHVSIFLFVPLIISKVISSFIEDRNAFTDTEQEEIKALLRRIEAKLP